MPTRKPKRTNWKQEAEKCYADMKVATRRLTEQSQEISELYQQLTRNKLVFEETLDKCAQEIVEREKWEKRALQAESERNALRKHVDELSAEKAELLKEREAALICEKCNRKGTVFAGKGLCQDCWNPKQSKRPSWLRRNWVELVVMAVVLGAIAFIVWRTW